MANSSSDTGGVGKSELVRASAASQTPGQLWGVAQSTALDNWELCD